MLRDILLFDVNPHSELADQLDVEIALLNQDAAQRPFIQSALTSAAAHAQTIARTKPQVEYLIEQFNALPTRQSIDAISTAHFREHTRAQKISQIYRLLLYLCSVILLGYGADRTVKIVKSRLAVEQAKASN